jgi:hypothetical protein
MSIYKATAAPGVLRSSRHEYQLVFSHIDDVEGLLANR